MGFIRPEVLVMGDAYPLPPTRQFLSKIVSFAQTGLLILGIGGRFIPAINNHPLFQKFQ